MAEYAVETCLKNPTLEGLNSLRKAELIQAARHFRVAAQPILRKADIRENVVQWLYDEEVWKEAEVIEEEISAVFGDSVNSGAKSIESELRLKELELEGKKIDLEMKSIEMKMKQMEFGTYTNKPQMFDLSRNAKLVPKFSEDKADEFSHHFEKASFQPGVAIDSLAYINTMFVGRQGAGCLCIPLYSGLFRVQDTETGYIAGLRVGARSL